VWRDLPVCGREVFFIYYPREIICQQHGRIQEDIPWAAPNARVTHRFEYALLIYCTIMTQKAAAQLLKIATSTLSDLLHRVIDGTRKGHKIRNLRKIGSMKSRSARDKNMPLSFTILKDRVLFGLEKEKPEIQSIVFSWKN
jgi:hypothetical protein